MNPQVKVALAGISGYGDMYLEALLNDANSRGIELVGVVDPTPERCRRLGDLHARGIPIHSDLQSLFSGAQVDLLMTATPIHLHAPQTCFALQRGASVLCEKPLAGTMVDAHRMLDGVRHARGFAAIGYQWSFSQAIQSLKRDIIGGVLGKPIRMKTLVYFPRPLSYFRRNNWVGRIKTSEGAGVLDSPANNATSHYLHNMFYVLGKTRETSSMPVTVQAELYRANDIENYDTAAIRAVTDCGTEILFYTTHAVAERKGPISRFEFELATVEYDAAGGGEFIARFHDGGVKSYGQPNLDRHEKIWQSVDAVRTGKPVACDVHAAMAHTVCVIAAQKSSSHIINFPSELRQMVDLENETMVRIDGLSELLMGCYEGGVLPSDHPACDWAAAGNIITIDKLPQPRAADLFPRA